MSHVHDKNLSPSPGKISFPHDRLFKESLSYVPIARDFFQHNLPPKLLQTIDLNTLALQPNGSMKKGSQAVVRRLSRILSFGGDWMVFFYSLLNI